MNNIYCIFLKLFEFFINDIYIIILCFLFIFNKQYKNQLLKLNNNFRTTSSSQLNMLSEYFSSHKKKMCSPFDSQSKKKKSHQVDRFIPHSISKNLYSMFKDTMTTNLEQINQHEQNKVKNQKNYTSFLQKNLMDDFNEINHNNSKVLHFGEQHNHFNHFNEKQNTNSLNLNNMNLETCYFKQKHSKIKQKKLIKQPYKILDVPMLKDDFYLNLVDWSDSNYIGVGLHSNLYIWSGCQSKVQKIYSSQNFIEQICSVNFMRHNPKICIGTNEGHVKVFDIFKPNSGGMMMNNLHTGRIGSVGCTNNLIITGGKDGYVSIQDIRTSQQVFRYKAHHQEISGLKISPNNDLIATGGNDNKLLLFSLRTMDKVVSWNQHNAAVKAIGFNPNHPSIASGGGTADKKLRIFSLNTFQKLSQVDTGSQICNLRFSPISNEMVTTHGYSLNQIILWKWDQNLQLTKVDSLMGHKNRVLYLAGEHQGSKIVTGAGDQQLRFWKVFDERQKQSICYDLR